MGWRELRASWQRSVDQGRPQRGAWRQIRNRLSGRLASPRIRHRSPQTRERKTQRPQASPLRHSRPTTRPRRKRQNSPRRRESSSSGTGLLSTRRMATRFPARVDGRSGLRFSSWSARGACSPRGSTRPGAEPRHLLVPHRRSRQLRLQAFHRRVREPRPWPVKQAPRLSSRCQACSRPP